MGERFAAWWDADRCPPGVLSELRAGASSRPSPRAFLAAGPCPRTAADAAAGRAAKALASSLRLIAAAEEMRAAATEARVKAEELRHLMGARPGGAGVPPPAMGGGG